MTPIDNTEASDGCGHEACDCRAYCKASRDPSEQWRKKLIELHDAALEAWGMYWDPATTSLTTIRKKNEASAAFLAHVAALQPPAGS